MTNFITEDKAKHFISLATLEIEREYNCSVIQIKPWIKDKYDAYEIIISPLDLCYRNSDFFDMISEIDFKKNQVRGFIKLFTLRCIRDSFLDSIEN